MAWKAIIIIHHWRIGLPSTYPSTTDVAVLVHQDCFLNEELGRAYYAPFLTKIFFGMSCSAVCHVVIVLHHRIRRKLYASVPKIDWACQGSRLPAYHSTASGGAHASELAMVSFYPAHHPKIRTPLTKGPNLRKIGRASCRA